MRWVILSFALFFAAVAGPVSALADEKPVTIRVTILDADGKPVKGAEVGVTRWPEPYEETPYATGKGNTKADGGFSAATDKKGKPFPSDTYLITAATRDGFAKTIVHIAPDAKSPVVLTLGPHSGSFPLESEFGIGVEQIAKNAQNNIEADERLADAAQQAADDFARDNDLQVKDLRGVTKDIERLNKLPKDLQDKTLLDKLHRYQAKLEGVQEIRRQIEVQKERLAKFKSDRKISALPSACPEGQSGGLLAGSINSLFGTDLAGVCDDQQSQRRDTDREKRDHHDRHERD
jgi:hypothetical protein